MQKSEYLALPEVAGFKKFVKGLLSDGEQFAHCYEMETRGRKQATTHWNCEGIYDAFTKYDWQYSYLDLRTGKKQAGRSFRDSELVLANLASELECAVTQNSSREARQICQMVLDWGGVLGSSTRGNQKKLEGFGDELAAYLRQAKIMFESHDLTLKHKYVVSTSNSYFPVVMNAGFTKIYSILCQDFIIYDGRVGAALGLLVRRYLEHDKDSKNVPESLAFHYGRAKNTKVNRNPSNKDFMFPGLGASSPAHIRSNIKANWILQDLRGGDLGSFSSLHNPLRAIEAALFMIGYRV